MNTAQKVRLEKEKHPERFCPRCLWRIQTSKGPNPCRKHPAPEVLMPSQKLLDQLEVIMHRNRQIARRQELFDLDPTCKVCTARVEHVEDCAPVKMADGSEHLCHNGCAAMQFQMMATRYFRSRK